MKENPDVLCFHPFENHVGNFLVRVIGFSSSRCVYECDTIRFLAKAFWGVPVLISLDLFGLGVKTFICDAILRVCSA